MSLPFNHLVQSRGGAELSIKEAESQGKLFNPDIPDKKDFANDRNIRDQWFNDRKLPTRPRSGGQFALPRTTFTDNPRLDSFMQNGSIDPNTIRKKVDPDSALPSRVDSASTLFSLQAGNLTAHDSVGLIQKARMSYSNYKNRFEDAPQRSSSLQVIEEDQPPPTRFSTFNSPVKSPVVSSF